MTGRSGSRGTPFDPQGVRFAGVDPKLTRVRILVESIGFLAVLLVVLAASLAAGWGLARAGAPAGWAWLVRLGPAAVVVAVWVCRLVVVPRQVRAIGYAEEDDDLLVRRGILFRRLVVVPYGRMQAVDVTAGPFLRAAGLASVQLHTASAASDAEIPGLRPDEAARLRERLASRGEARLAGL